jgi:hypothetical protein
MSILKAALVTAFAFAAASCATVVDLRRTAPEQVRLGVYCKEADLRPPPPEVQKLADSILPTADVIRGVWSKYPHRPDPGLRVNVQVNSQIWTEALLSGVRTNFLIERRDHVEGESGTILLRLRGNSIKPHPLPYTPLEAFIPDRGSRTHTSFFRIQQNGLWGDWQPGTVFYEFK